MDNPESITVGELIEKLSIHDKRATLYFEGMTYLRVKERGPGLVQIEFTLDSQYDESPAQADQSPG